MNSENGRAPYLLLIPGVLVLVISGCTGFGRPGAEASATPEAVTPSATPQPVTPTPVATARPLVEVVAEPGTYRSDIVGVMLDYPDNWQVLSRDGAGGELLVLGSPDRTVLVFLTYGILAEGEDLGATATDYIGQLPSLLGLTDGRSVASDPAYHLGDGTPAWRAIGEGQDSAGDWLRYDVVAAERTGRAFFLTLLAYAPDYQAQLDTLDSIRQSLEVYVPRPYGVDRTNALFLPGEEPETFDPARWRYDAGGIVGDLFSGLVQLGTDLRPIPDLAERWEVSPDGTRYTFYLRRGVTFHNGDPFTADDVVFSWDRALAPDTESDTALTYLGDILGAAQVASGEAEHLAGLRIVDDHTLEVTIDGPKAYFLAKLAYPTSWIVDQETAEEIEESPIGTGPFVLVQHTENQVIILARNPSYHRGPVALEYIVYMLYPGPLDRLYEASEIDIDYIDESLLSRANNPSDPLYGDVQATGELCTYYVAFDVTRPPFDDPLVRRAFAMAIDRQRYVDVVTGGTGVVADGLYPPGLPGYNPDVNPIPFDSAQALRLLEESSYGGPDALPEIVFTTSGAGGDLPPSTALMLQMWREALGVEVRVEQLDSDSFNDQVYAGNHGQLITRGWCADYPDPENFADVLFHSGMSQNVGSYANPEMDASLEQARVEPNIDQRLQLYQGIEQRLVDDVPAIFLQHSQVYYTVVKPYLHGYVSTPIGVAQHMNLSIER